LSYSKKLCPLNRRILQTILNKTEIITYFRVSLDFLKKENIRRLTLPFSNIPRFLGVLLS
jgi:hypothetical protein